MEVILNQDVEKIGKSGAVVKVKDGFARNFLIPRGLAVPVTALNLKKLEQQKQIEALKIAKTKKEAEDLLKRLADLSVTIGVLAQEDKLYGSVTTAEIAAALKEEGFQIDKDAIILDEAIKATGIYDVSIRLHPDILAKIKVWIVKK